MNVGSAKRYNLAYRSYKSRTVIEIDCKPQFAYVNCEAMRTSKDRLQWLIEFAQTPQLSAATETKEWEWLKLKDEILEFIYGRTGLLRFEIEVDSETDPADGLTKERIDQLRKTARLVVHEFVHDADTRAFVRLQFGFAAKGFVFRGSMADLFYVRLGLVICDEGISQIKECPECHRLFYRIRKHKYCSKTCINRVSRKKWLKKPQNRKKESKWARERYKRRMREKTNGNIKIQERNKGGNR